ncbi:MAG: helix-turn-helix domain-containing protein [Desulfobacteraceae bacterium]|nr:helix-turn-helix domain-containing protein [Desulfobacteraceae bacterium]
MHISLRKAFKYRIRPRKYQIPALENQFFICRYLYNWNIQDRIDTYQKNSVSVTYNGSAGKLPELKKQRPCFKPVYSKYVYSKSIYYQVLQDVLKQIDKGFHSFFSRTKQGDVPGFAKFKKKGQRDSIIYPQYKKHLSTIITVLKAGDIKMRCNRSIGESAKVKTLTGTKDADKWFVCFSVELAFGIDLK